MPLRAKQFPLQFGLFVCALLVYAAIIGFTLIIRGAGMYNTLEKESRTNCHSTKYTR